MRIYSRVIDLFTETVRELFARGQTSYDPTVQGIKVPREEYEMMELIGYSYKLTIWSDLCMAMDWWRERFNRRWVSCDTAKRWAKSMMEDSNPDDWWKGVMDEYWYKFSSYPVFGRFEYTYGERLAPQIERLISHMMENPGGKGHFIAVWHPTDTGMKWRKPCTIGYQFLWRDGRGYIVVYQRSLDLVNFFPLDVAKAIFFGEEIMKRAGMKLTHLIHFIGSLHAYKADVPSDLRW